MKRCRSPWMTSPAPAIPLRRRLAAEALGTSFLLIAVVGSGILGERLAAGNTAPALPPNALATGAALFTLTCIGR